MPFYKKENEELKVAPNFVLTPTAQLYAENHADYTYPVEGWHWFDSLDDAMTYFINTKNWMSVTPRQIRQAFTQYGIRSAIEAAISNADQNTRDWYEFSTMFERNNPVSVAMAASLGFTSQQMDEVWQLAASL